MNKELQQKLDNLSQIKLSEDAKKRGFDFLMQKVAERGVDLSQYKAHERPNFYTVLNVFKFKFVYIAVIILLIFIGGSYVQSRIDNSLPDNGSLYTVKRALEKAQITLSFSSEKKARIMVGLLDKRAEEINKILKKPDANIVKKVGKAIKTTKDDVENIKKYLKEKDDGVIQDKAKEKALKFQIVLENIVEQLPEEVENELKREIEDLNKELGNIIEEPKDDDRLQAAEEENNPVEADFYTTNTKPTTTTSTISANLEEDTSEKSASTSDDMRNVNKNNQVEEKFSVEDDTFEVYIGK